jgi:hypothetical protein
MTTHIRPGRGRLTPTLSWLQSIFAVLIMAGALAYLRFVVRGVMYLPEALGRGEFLSALGVLLAATLWTALFSIGAGLWSRTRSPRPGAGAAWQRAFRVACGLAVGLMLLILAVSIVPKL